MAKGKSKKDLEQEIGELTADIQRIQADFINYKRRSEEDVARARMSGKSSMIMALLPVIDNLERALSHQPKELEKNDWAKGVTKVSEQLMKSLSDIGVYKIDTKDQEFNPDFMEAVSVEGDGDKEMVAEELQAGYIMNEEVIRPAMVKVERN